MVWMVKINLEICEMGKNSTFINIQVLWLNSELRLNLTWNSNKKILGKNKDGIIINSLLEFISQSDKRWIIYRKW